MNWNGQKPAKSLVPKAGLEPARYHYRGILNSRDLTENQQVSAKRSPKHIMNKSETGELV